MQPEIKIRLVKFNKYRILLMKKLLQLKNIRRLTKDPIRKIELILILFLTAI
jgi:hypothetical protein